MNSVINKTYHHIRMRCSISDSIGVRVHRSHVQPKPQLSNVFYSRFPGRRALFSVPARRFSSAASGASTLASLSTGGPVLWYLSMIKARPIITKSVTCALSFTAADLTSQVLYFFRSLFLRFNIRGFC